LTALIPPTPQELEILLACARSFHQQASDSSNGASEYRPGDHYNQRVTWGDVLTPHGWHRGRQSGEVIYWRRPGKDAPGHSATTGRCRTPRRGDLLYVCSCNAAPLESEKSYSKFEAYALLNHRGEFKAAAAALARCGFGDPLRTGRVSRDREAVDHPALSVGLAVQPDVIRGLAAEATLRTRGFLARFLYALPNSMVGHRQIASPPVPAHIAAAYRKYLLALWELSGAVAEDSKPAPHLLQFTTEADAAKREFERWLEPLLAPGEELSLLAGWANKLAGAIARVAGVFHVAAAIGEGSDWLTPIDHRTVESAIALGRDYLLPHARAAFALMGADEKLEKARHVWESLSKRNEYRECSENAPPRVTRRQIHQCNRRQFVSAKDLDPVLQVLIDRGYLAAIPASGEAGRGHSSPAYFINPLAMTMP
jgi:hypothetical protein